MTKKKIDEKARDSKRTHQRHYSQPPFTVIAAFAVCIPLVIMSLLTVCSQGGPVNVVLPRAVFLWGVGTVLVFGGFRLVAHKNSGYIPVGLLIVVVGICFLFLPNFLTIFMFPGGE